MAHRPSTPPADDLPSSANTSTIGARRLRAQSLARPFEVVLVHPEIPPNTGNVARLCAATGCRLHLVHPLGFRVDEKAVRRAGLDYWHLLEVREHQSVEAWLGSLPADARLHLFTGKSQRSYLQARYQPGDILVFGRESTGLDDTLLAERNDSTVAIPMPGRVRSINLANAVALGVYEALRQSGTLNHVELG